MAPITEMSCWQNKCCQQYNRSLEITFIFQQDSAPAHRARDTVDFLRRSTPQFITPRHVAKQPKPQPGRLQDLGCDAGSSVQNGDPRPGRSEATSDCRLVRSAAEYRRRNCRSVTQTSALLRGRKRAAVTSNICCNIATGTCLI